MLIQTAAAPLIANFAQDVRTGLSKEGQKTLPCRYFYDEIGSSLFEIITRLAEYGLSRASGRLLRKYASAVVSKVPLRAAVAELGCGSGKMTRRLVEPLARRGPITYHAIEISGAALAACRRELEDIPSLRVVGWEREYLDGMQEAGASRTGDEHLLLLFLGSTIGNFERREGVEFLKQVRQYLAPGDSLLLGTDLEKPVPALLRAYDDALGVTAAFNLNLLARINRELDADFRLSQFRHVACYHGPERRIEMHLESTAEQTVAIPGANLEVSFRRGETIWTESSHKYDLDEVAGMARQSGFDCDAQWVDEEWPFANSFLVAE